MYEYAIAWDWLTFAVRWLHVITGVAWIGSSFYFVALDLGLRKRPDLPAGAYGEEWQVHGGGFYHIQKYLVAPANMPEHLIWFKWESYVTWLSGFGMLALVYYAGADLYLIDPNVLDVSKPVAIGISLASLAFGWIIYDLLCKSRFGNDNTRLMVALYFILVAIAWGYTQLFTGRAAFLHLGAFTATIMSANVFFIIMPNQRIVVADLIAGRTPDAKYGRIAKQRSTHNNYITLPVLFLMLSNHYPITYANAAVIPLLVALVIVAGALIRHFYNVRHADHAKSPWWCWAVAILALWLAFWVAMSSSPGGREQLGLKPREAGKPVLLAGMTLPPVEVSNIVAGRCAMCHAPEPSWPGIQIAPKGVLLHEPEQIAAHARAIRMQAVMTHAMPPNNLSGMTPAERKVLAGWLAAGR